MGDEYASFPDEALPLVEVREGPTEGPGGWSLHANAETLALLGRIEARLLCVRPIPARGASAVFVFP